MSEDVARRGDGSLPGPVLALDLGERRIGVALSDRRRILASPYTVLERRGAHDQDHEAIARLVEEANATLVVVGLPLALSGATGPAATKALAEIEELRAALSVPVVAQDERLSTVEATRRLQSTRGDQKRRSPATKRRVIVDDRAAAVLLESYLQSAGRESR